MEIESTGQGCWRLVAYKKWCWTGLGFSAEPARALLYTTRAAAEADLERVTSQLRATEKVVSVSVPMRVMMMARGPLDEVALLRFFKRHVELAHHELETTPDCHVYGLWLEWEHASVAEERPPEEGKADDA